MKVSEIMSSAPSVLQPQTPVRELESRLIGDDVGGFPVVDGEKLVGIVTRSDLVRILEVEQAFDEQLDDHPGASPTDDAERARGARIGARLASMTVADLMVHDVRTVSPDDDVVEAARAMLERGVHRVPVVDGTRLVGILTSFDVIRLVANGQLS